MNRFCAVAATIVLLVCVRAESYAQGYLENIALRHIDAYSVGVSCEQTTNIIFPFAIKSVDRGNAWVLVQKAKGAENVLQLKAGRKELTPTNVTVICADGELYSFLLEYVPFPAFLNIQVEKNLSDAGAAMIQLTDQPLDLATYISTGKLLMKFQPFLRVHQNNQLMDWRLRGIYLAKNLLWFNCQLSNGSLIDFVPSSVRFFIRDEKRNKRTAVQEKEIIPVYDNADSLVTGMNYRQMVFAFEPFTLSKSQQLIMQIAERNGGRQLKLRIKPKVLLKARPVKN